MFHVKRFGLSGITRRAFLFIVVAGRVVLVRGRGALVIGGDSDGCYAFLYMLYVLYMLYNSAVSVVQHSCQKFEPHPRRPL